ncbi:hypothetical protein THAOC_07787, partial [Thalassiosira oceanica]
MPESELADNSDLEYTPLLPPWCTSGQYWPSSDGPVYRASSRWFFCFTAFVTRGQPWKAFGNDVSVNHTHSLLLPNNWVCDSGVEALDRQSLKG